MRSGVARYAGDRPRILSPPLNQTITQHTIRSGAARGASVHPFRSAISVGSLSQVLNTKAPVELFRHRQFSDPAASITIRTRHAHWHSTAPPSTTPPEGSARGFSETLCVFKSCPRCSHLLVPFAPRDRRSCMLGTLSADVGLPFRTAPPFSARRGKTACL